MEKKPINYYEGFELAVANAKNHVAIAELIVKNKLGYGVAASHLILAAEEAIKAWLTFFKYFDPDIKVKDYDKLFKDHGIKHERIINVERYRAFILKLVKFTQAALKQIENKPPAEEEAEGAVMGFFMDFFQLLIDIGEGNTQLEYNKEWWAQANTNRNNGFYVGLNEGNAKWHNPGSVKKSDYIKAKTIVSELLDELFKIDKIFSQPEALERYREFKAKCGPMFNMML